MDYEKKTNTELIAICKERGIKGYSGKKKDAIIALLMEGIQEEIANIKLKPTKNTSPLRYPGGKTRAISLLESYVTEHYPTKKTLLSPFFGGGSFELHMKTKGYSIKGNDLFVPLYTFWKTLQSDPITLLTKIREKMPITKEVFHQIRI